MTHLRMEEGWRFFRTVIEETIPKAEEESRWNEITRGVEEGLDCGASHISEGSED